MPTGVYIRTKEHIEKLKNSNNKSWFKNGHKVPISWIDKIIKKNTGRKYNIDFTERGKKISNSKKGKQNYSQRGENNNNWKGGKTLLTRAIRTLFEYKLWRKLIFERDNYKCVLCEAKSGNGITVILQADHIKPFSTILKENNIKSLEEARSCKELWNIDNGRTLCKECHIKTDTYGSKLNKNINH